MSDINEIDMEMLLDMLLISYNLDVRNNLNMSNVLEWYEMLNNVDEVI